MNTTQLECFLAVASFLNFSRAAQQLRITQPAVSHQINTLEDELGVKLFHRTSKNVQLTQSGHLFLQYASQILKLSGLSKAMLRQGEQTFPQSLGIGCHNFTELNFLRLVFRQLRQQAPNVVPILRMIPFASLERLLEEEEIHAILTLRESAPAKAVYQELASCPVVCVCADDHPLAGHSSLTLDRLAQAGKITVCPPPVSPPSLLAAQNQAAAGRGPDQMLFCDNLETALALVQAGYGFSIQADLPAARLPGLRYIPIPEFPPLSYGVSYLSQHRSPALRAFMHIARAAAATPSTTLPPPLS